MQSAVGRIAHHLEAMNVEILKLESSDLEALNLLQNQFKRTIGFLSWETLEEFLRKGGVLGAKVDGKVVGYLLFAEYSDRIRVVQLCVDSRFQGNGIARRLMDNLKERATTQAVIRLSCRRDFPASAMWPGLGFIPVEERPGRGKDGGTLTIWSCSLQKDDPLGLWRASMDDACLDVVIDAQVFFDLEEPASPKSAASQALASDSLSDSIQIWITDELFIEINSQRDNQRRDHSLKRAHGFFRVAHDREAMQVHLRVLKTFLPYRRAQDKSDLHHIAKTAASPVKTFVTRDDGILKRASDIEERVGVRVVHPATLVSNIREIKEEQTFLPSRISGMRLAWSRVRGIDLEHLDYSRFLVSGETKGQLRETLHELIIDSDGGEFLMLNDSNEGLVALVSVSRREKDRLMIPWMRVLVGGRGEMYRRFVITHLLSLSVAEARSLVLFDCANDSKTEALLIVMGFIKIGNFQGKLLMQGVFEREGLMRSARFLIGDSNLSDLEVDVESVFAPAVVVGGLPCYLVPIKPGYAMGLIDAQESAGDLFGGDPSVLLRWENVYYRAATCKKMLRAPGRVLWYVSGRIGEVIAISYLDEVCVDEPKPLFKRYERYGVLAWRDLFQLCRKNPENEIMALRFSQTFSFRHRLSYLKLKELYDQAGLGLGLQSPSLVCEKIYHEIVRVGFETHE